MKSISDFFEEFLKDEVNLNPTRLKVAKKGINTMKKFLKKSDIFKGHILQFSPQGSYRQGTIIKPLNGKDFDVDLLVILKEFEGWKAKDYLNNLHQVFKDSDKYQDIVDRRGKSRCVTIDYASDFHIDIIPAIEIDGRFKIMNKNSNTFEDTDGDGYAEWFEKKNSITSSKFLTKTVRLFKYLRDIKLTFSIKSILLTTLLGEQVYDYEDNTYYQETYYKDLHTTLKTLFNRLDSYLQARPYLNDDITNNPVLSSEKFNRHWDQDKYSNFREKVNDYNQWVNDAYEEQDVNEAVKKWRKIFGDDFGEIQEKAVSTSASAKFSVIDSVDYEEFIEHKYPDDLDNDWRLALSVNPKSRSGFRDFHYPKDVWLRFYVDKNKSFLPNNTVIKWKVKNSGQEARNKHQLRGRIEEDDSENWTKTEHTKYKGRHYVECYALRNGFVIATDIIYVTVV
ncbi:MULTISPECIES: SMODS domain-containing nucleotidyltransferase [Cyanophyceae]|uniref:SMODS domain-containing nucleotidyltransferase n=1 Tax=Cyanophyceae TaxID=3028117 RepID=UPI001682101F|nr:nucleotidyltransferase [Trichocoleus sp. FACHB-69]MBD1932762.1 nucleotidyltransferase [Trichocoleus sp. FACHB-69]